MKKLTSRELLAELQRRTGGKREDNLMDWPAVRNMPSYMQEFLPQYLGYLEENGEGAAHGLSGGLVVRSGKMIFGKSRM